MINYNVKYTNKNNNKTDEFKMVFKGFAFFFEDSERKELINPFFCNENQRQIAKIIFADDSELLENPKRQMTFEDEKLLITVTEL